jgi:F-type H+-transporting ATPase subunit epsilon
MAEKLNVRVVTPSCEIFNGVADEVILPGTEGYLGILPEHSPLIALLGIGVLTVKEGGETSTFALNSGFVEVLPEGVTILARTVERPQEIDVDRAENAKKRAEERLFSGDPDVDLVRARTSLRRALARLGVLSR